MKDLVMWISPEKFAGVLARFGSAVEIGRASCRERVCQYV